MIAMLDILLLILTLIYACGLLLFFVGLYFPNRWTSVWRPFVSVVVAARNEEATIAGLLSDLRGQTYPADRFEVIVVDDQSEDKTADVITQAANSQRNVHLVRVEEEDDTGLIAKKRAMDLGIRSSLGEIILTTDADCRVLPRWIETMVSYFTEDVGMVAGFSQSGRKGEPLTTFQRIQSLDFLSLMAAAQGVLNLGLPLAASGQNLAYLRQAFDEVGGFGDIRNRISGDDVLLMQLVRKKTRWSVRFAPAEESFNTAPPEPSLKSFFRQRIRWASNGPIQWRLNRMFFCYVVTTFLVNALLIISPILHAVSGQSLRIFAAALAIKIASEGLLLLKGSAVYQRRDLLRDFPLWTLFQIPYVVIAGLAGSLGLFTWKGRRHNQPEAETS